MKNQSLSIHRVEGHPILRFVAGRMLVCDSASADWLADEVTFPIPPEEWERVRRAVESFNAIMSEAQIAEAAE
jgi:hypothetical protein